MTPKFKAIRSIWNVLSIFSGAHIFPGEGKPLKSCELTFFNETEVADDFDDFVRYEAWSMGCHMINAIVEGLNSRKPMIKWKGLIHYQDISVVSYGIDSHQPLKCPEDMAIGIDLGFV